MPRNKVWHARSRHSTVPRFRVTNLPVYRVQPPDRSEVNYYIYIFRCSRTQTKFSQRVCPYVGLELPTKRS